MSEERYSYAGLLGVEFIGTVVMSSPQDGVYIGPIVRRGGLDGTNRGLSDGRVAQELSPGRIALHDYDSMPRGDEDSILWRKDGVHEGRPTAWGQVMRVEYRDGRVISCHSTGSRADNWRQAERLIMQMKKAFGPKVPEYSSRLNDGAQIGWDDEEVRR